MNTFTFKKELSVSDEQVYAFAQGVSIPLKKQVEVEESYTEEETNEQGETVTVDKTRTVTKLVDKTKEEIVAEVQAYGDNKIDSIFRGEFRAVLNKIASKQIEDTVSLIMK